MTVREPGHEGSRGRQRGVPFYVLSIIVVVGIAGILLNDPTVFYHLHPTASQWLVWFGTNFLLLLVLAGAGVRLGPTVGLGASEAGDARLAWRRLRAGLPAAGGLAGVSIVWFLAVATALHHLDFIQSELAEPMWVAQLGGVGAGISEEIGYRLGIMTVLVWPSSGSAAGPGPPQPSYGRPSGSQRCSSAFCTWARRAPRPLAQPPAEPL